MDPATPGFLARKTFTRAGEDGAFDLAIRSEHPVRIHAWGPRSKPSSLERLVPAEADVDLGDIVLPEGARLAGRVRCGPTTEGALQALVWVHRVGVTGGLLAWGDEGRAVVFEDGEPVSAGQRTLCAEDGSWEVVGLTPGEYHVSVISVADAWIHSSLSDRTRRRATAPAVGIDFDLDCSVVWLSVQAPLGQFLTEYRAEVTDLTGSTSSWNAGADRRIGAQDVQGFGMALPANASVDVRVVRNDYLPAQRRILAPAAGSSAQVTFTLAYVERSLLILEAGERWQKERRWLNVTLLEPDTDRRVYQERALCGPDEQALAVPVGTWDLLLELDSPDRQLPHPDYTLPQRTRVVVARESPTHATWDPPLGGLFSLEVQPGGDSRDAGPVTCQLAWPRGPLKPCLFVPLTERAPLVGVPGTVYLFPQPLRRGSRSLVAESLPPGPVTVVLSAPGYRELRVPVVIESKAIAELTATLVPE